MGIEKGFNRLSKEKNFDVSGSDRYRDEQIEGAIEKAIERRESGWKEIVKQDIGDRITSAGKDLEDNPGFKTTLFNEGINDVRV